MKTGAKTIKFPSASRDQATTGAPPDSLGVCLVKSTLCLVQAIKNF